jgi:hypothetical protein
MALLALPPTPPPKTAEAALIMAAGDSLATAFRAAALADVAGDGLATTFRAALADVAGDSLATSFRTALADVAAESLTTSFRAALATAARNLGALIWISPPGWEKPVWEETGS